MDQEPLLFQRTAGFQRRTMALIVFVGMVVALLIFASYRLGSRMIERYTPLMDAVMELQLHATTSHLWFEEILSGDRNEDMESVYLHLKTADLYAELMLSGGVFEGLKFVPLKDEALREHIRMLRDKLARFREIMDERWAMRATSGPGSEIDQRFDKLFNDAINEAREVERRLNEHNRQALQSFMLTHVVLLLLAVIITISVGWVVRRFMLRQAYGVHLLERANLELATEVEKRKRTEALLEKQASTDHLTGILSRGRMSELLEEEWTRVARYPEHFSLLMFDIDHFKQVNDTLGHQAGDLALVKMSRHVKRLLRDIDAFSRWGGDEFLILLPGTDLPGAEEVAERCRKAISTVKMEGIDKLTASFGVVEFSTEDATLQQLLKRADTALYMAKHAGRDQVKNHT